MKHTKLRIFCLCKSEIHVWIDNSFIGYFIKVPYIKISGKNEICVQRKTFQLHTVPAKKILTVIDFF